MAQRQRNTGSGVNGLVLSPDRKWLYYHALTVRTLYRTPTIALRDQDFTGKDLASLA